MRRYYDGLSLVTVFATVFAFRFLSSAVVRANDSAPCTVCSDGTSIPSDFVDVAPGAFVGFETWIRNCGDLETIASSSQVNSTSPTCTLIRSVSTLCGCPIEEDKCRLCPNKGSVPPEFRDTITDFPQLASLQFPPRCDVVEATLHTVNAESDTWRGGQGYAEICGCLKTGANSTAVQTPQVHPEHLDDAPPEKPAPVPSCTMCRDGQDFIYPEKDIQPFLERNSHLFQEIPADFNFTNMGPIVCQAAEGLLASMFIDGTDQCHEAQDLVGAICGCPPPKKEGSCTFCPNDDGPPDSDKLLYSMQFTIGLLLTCSELNLTLTRYDESSIRCFNSKQVNHICGCNSGDRHYGGADTEVKRAFFAWIPRVSGLASWIGSVLIIRDVFKDKKKRPSVYHQLILGLSFFDCFSSMAWTFSTAPIPKYEDGELSGVYGALGNQATCTTQGFFVQLGTIGSLSYNVVLSFYYVLVIVKSFREWQLKPLRKWMHGVPIVLAFGLAFAGLPYYTQVCVTFLRIPRFPIIIR